MIKDRKGSRGGNMYRHQQKANIILPILFVFGIGFFIWYGYGYERSTVTKCIATVERWIEAEFSEEECGVDFDGYFYCETDYWSEKASSVNKEVTINEYPIRYPKYPEIEVDFSKDSSFDNYDKNQNVSLKSYLSDGDYLRVNNSEFKQCVSNLGKVKIIKTWYGIKYSIG